MSNWLAKFGRDKTGAIAAIFAIGALPISGAIMVAIGSGLQGTQYAEVQQVVDTVCSRVKNSTFDRAMRSDRQDAARDILDRHLPHTQLDMSGATYDAIDVGDGLVVSVAGELQSLTGRLATDLNVAIEVNCDGETLPTTPPAGIVFFEGFEAPLVRDSGYSRWNIEPYLPNWDLTAGSGTQLIETTAGRAVYAFEGQQFAELDGDPLRGAIPGRSSNSAITRTVTLAIGRYQLSYFYHAHHAGIAPSDQEIAVFVDPIDGSSLFGNQVHSTSQSSGWVERRVEFDIDWDGDHRITFSAKGDANELGGFLDAITLTRL